MSKILSVLKIIKGIKRQKTKAKIVCYKKEQHIFQKDIDMKNIDLNLFKFMYQLNNILEARIFQ